jgi:hypothetical protein
MDTNNLSNCQEIVTTYLAAWNAVSQTDREELLAKSFSPTATYLDPHVTNPLTGIEQMSELIAQFRTRFRHKIEPTSIIDVHHNVFRVSWQLRDESDAVISTGLFCGEIDRTSRISKLIGFVD